MHASDEPQPEVAVWGLGVQFRHYNMLGHCVPVFVTEGGIGRGSSATQPLTLLLNALAGGSGGNDYTTYAASASYITSNAVGMVLENSELALFDVSRLHSLAAALATLCSHFAACTDHRWRLLVARRQASCRGGGLGVLAALAVCRHAKKLLGLL